MSASPGAPGGSARVPAGGAREAQGAPTGAGPTAPAAAGAQSDRRRWLALAVLCLGELMIVLDTTIVNVALPSIRADLRFTEASLVWVVNAYMLTFGGFLLLGGRLGDLYGPRRLFLGGIVAFTVASMACGLASTQAMLVVARAVQGIAGAVVSAVALSLIMGLFSEPAERARAMGVYGFVCAGGGSVGVLLGGLLTSNFGWPWVFLVNLPIGIGVFALGLAWLGSGGRGSGLRLDWAGAVTVTASLMLAVYAVVGGNGAGWTSTQTLGTGAAALALFALFLGIEARIDAPLMPLAMFRLRSLSASSAVAVLWSAAMFAWFFISALYLQQVLGYSAMQVGLAFLPANLIMAVLSIGLSARLVMRFGIAPTLVGGLALAALGLALFARAPADGGFLVDVLPGMLLLGIGGGVAFNPLLMAAMHEAPVEDAGLASGMLNTAFMMGGALGLAVLASLAGARTEAALAQGLAERVALNAGYQLAAGLGAATAALAALISLVWLRLPLQPAGEGGRAATGAVH